MLVAGGARGIGFACAQRLAQAGARVVIADPGSTVAGEAGELGAAAAAAAQITEAGGTAFAVEEGIGDIEDGERIVAACREHLQRIDAAVVPATVLRDARLERMSAWDWEAVLHVNLTGLFGLVRALAPVMREQRYGRIVTFTSRSGIEGRGDGAANYAAAKMGVIGLTKSVAKELGPDGVLANSVAPRARTRSSEATAERLQTTGRMVDLSAVGAPEDIANLVLYLASPACEANGRVFWSSGSQLGLFPEQVATQLADGDSPLGVDDVARLVSAQLERERAAE